MYFSEIVNFMKARVRLWFISSLTRFKRPDGTAIPSHHRTFITTTVCCRPSLYLSFDLETTPLYLCVLSYLLKIAIYFEMELEDFEPLFGEPKVEWSATGSDTTPVRPFLFQVHAPDSSHLRFHATDFFSSSFAAVRSIEQLDDMRDDTGIGGSWSEFLEYLVNSIKFGDVKLILEGKSKSDGPESAKLIAQKSKGMPRISISLHKRVGTDANETMAMLSLDLYKAHQRNHKLLYRSSNELKISSTHYWHFPTVQK